jgi:hypothetical protein
MLLLGALLALLAAGLWMYALIDVLLTPRVSCRKLAKGPWLAIVGLLLVPGALAWLIFGRPSAATGRYRSAAQMRLRHRGLSGLDAEAAVLRHPAGRTRYQPDWPEGPADLTGGNLRQLPPQPWTSGPDDDPEFLRYLDRVVRDIREAGNGA